jgi:hypothetical protein
MSVRALGREGFVWFIGVVEDREDPLKLGRVRVRIYDVHSQNKALLPTDQLPWASILMPAFSPSHDKVGISPTGLTIGSTVVGFFADGNECNQPVIMGTMFGIPENNISKHDVPEVARGINNIVKNRDSFEPESPFAARYPYNKVIRTERGHVIEIDDTPGQERIHILHTSGTYREINKDGRLVEKTVDNSIEIVLKDKTVHVNGNVNIKVDGSYTLNVDGDIVINGKTVNINNGTMGAARIGDTADTGDPAGAVGTNIIETGSQTVFIGD